MSHCLMTGHQAVKTSGQFWQTTYPRDPKDAPGNVVFVHFIDTAGDNVLMGWGLGTIREWRTVGAIKQLGWVIRTIKTLEGNSMSNRGAISSAPIKYSRDLQQRCRNLASHYEIMFYILSVPDLWHWYPQLGQLQGQIPQKMPIL